MWRKWMVTGVLSAVLIGGAGPGEATVAAPVVLRQEATQVPVLLYHHLDPMAGEENGAVISVAEFDTQMDWLSRNGYTALTTAELAAWLDGEGQLPPKPVLITFDDGYRSNYEYAFPILQRHGMKATIFMITAAAGRTDGDLPHLSWEEMREMERSGIVEIQAHTHDGHRKLGGRPALVAWDEPAIRSDLQLLQASLEKAELMPATAVAYPFGGYDAEAIRTLGSEGIGLGFTVEHGYVRRGDEPLRLKRLIVYPGFSAGKFGELVTGRR